MDPHTVTPAGLIPNYLFDPLAEYVLLGIRTGGFLQSVLENDLQGALQRASGPTSFLSLPAICMFVANFLPAESWGSRVDVDNWVGKGSHYPDVFPGIPENYDFVTITDQAEATAMILSLAEVMGPWGRPERKG